MPRLDLSPTSLVLALALGVASLGVGVIVTHDVAAGSAPVAVVPATVAALGDAPGGGDVGDLAAQRTAVRVPLAGPVTAGDADAAPATDGPAGEAPEAPSTEVAPDAADPAEEVAAEPVPAPAAATTLAGRTERSLLPDLDLDAVDDVAARTGIPARALAAYAGVALHLADERPGCEITWVTLAAIGWVESHHGTLGGRTLQADGTPDRAIVGVPLDGGPGVRAIRDTDGGRWDGDPTWDRAVGPMQFIPSTWQRWQVDASGSGTADPQHIDDAALAAGRYLCASGGGSLTQAEAWYRAVFAYNRSDAYVRSVLDAANTYAARANG